MQSLLLLLSVAGYMYFFCTYMKCKFIQAPFYFVTFTIVMLYPFAISGYLVLGVYICLILGMLFGVATVYLNRGHRPEINKNNLYEICYLIPLAIVIFSIPSYYQFMDWDEFSFWGLSIKIIAKADSLYNANYPTEYNYYPPGQQLFQYFIIKFLGWSEKNALYAHVFMSFSALCFIAGSFYKTASLKTVLSLFAVCMFLYYFGFVYASVYSDKLVAFYFCAALTCAFFPRSGIFPLIFLCFVLAALVLIKQIGLLLALLVVGVYCVANYPSHSNLKHYPSNNLFVRYWYMYRFLLISIVCLFAFIYFPYQSWKWYVDSIGANKHFYAPGLLEFLQGERLQMLGAILVEFFGRIHAPNFLNIRNFGISLLDTTLIMLIISLIGIAICERGNRLRFSLIAGIIFIGWVGYILFHLYAYQVFFGKWEALTLSSFERYAAIYCLAWILFIYFAVSRYLMRFESRLADAVLLVFCCITLIGLYPKVRWDLGESFTTYNYDILQRINRDKVLVSANVKDSDSVYFISQGATAYDRWAFYYAVYPKMKKFNPWSLCPERDGYACSYKDFPEALVGSNYLMLSKADDYFWTQAGHLFDSSEYGTKSGLYAVEYKDGVVVKLTKIK